MIDDLRLARAVQDAVLAVDGVYSLGVGRYAEAATYGPGEKVMGVVVGPAEIRVHVVAHYPLTEPIPALAERVRERVASKAGDRTTTVVVEDLKVAQDESL